ncbi:uncharacterized protein LOC116400846 [Anarrhichthys ocellatus]|uniref:uncharacterized protein LOC116400846 n=1 Tax=Anarrhichthys ocellatus TaxID=433405 RepID=UPI0012ED501C|nr:uncharacterized protein LOC116400846 [Anarrhichthys ocellatus]
MVKQSDLKACGKDKHVCVTDPRDCEPRPPASTWETLNMSCYYQESHRSFTCVWSRESNSHTEPDVSLIFSRTSKIDYCPAFINPTTVLNVTARIKDYTGREIWSRPHTVDLKLAVKPSQPVLSLLASTEDSVSVSWRSSGGGVCRLRYRVDGDHTWTWVIIQVTKTLFSVLCLSTKSRYLYLSIYMFCYFLLLLHYISGINIVLFTPPHLSYSFSYWLLPVQVKPRISRCVDAECLFGCQALDSVPAHEDQTQNYTIKDLLVSTVYRAAVACIEKSGIWWSDWSSDVSARTLDKAPSRPPEVCYRVEKNDSGGSFLLHLMWKDLDLRDAGGRILGYQVSYEPSEKKKKKRQQQQQQQQHRHIQNVTEVTALLEVDEGNCSVTVAAFNAAGYGPAAHLSIDPERWTTPPSVRHFWVSSSFPAMKGLLVQWENPKVPPTVPPVSHLAVQWRSQTRPTTGSRWTTVDNLTTSAVIPDVDREESYLISVFPIYHQQCGPPQSLPASLQQGGNNSNNSFIYILSDEVPVVAAATPLLLLAVIVFIISILSRTLYKSYFFPPICSPQGSTTGQWLMDPNHQKAADRHVLDMEDFQVTDVLVEKSLITVCPNSEEDLHEDASPLSIVKLSALQLDTEYRPDAPGNTEHPLVSLQSYHADYPDNRRHPDAVFLSEDVAPLRHTSDANGRFAQRDDETELKRETFDLCELVANGHDVYQMTCEAEYVANGCLICESDCAAKSCQTAEEE